MWPAIVLQHIITVQKYNKLLKHYLATNQQTKQWQKQSCYKQQPKYWSDVDVRYILNPKLEKSSRASRQTKL